MINLDHFYLFLSYLIESENTLALSHSILFSHFVLSRNRLLQLHIFQLCGSTTNEIMSRSFLFGGQPTTHQSNYLVQFRAGKMTVRDNMVTPILRKGLVYLNQTDDNLMHFCWKDRSSNVVEDDLIIFPEDAEFKRVAQCTTGRVYVLRFKSSSRRCFYWMQDPTEDRDEELCRKVNKYLNNPPAPGSRAGSASSNLSSLDMGSLHDQDLQHLFSTVTPQQLMQMLGNVSNINPPAMLSGLLNQTSGRSGSGSSSKSSSSTTSSSATNTTPSATSTTSAASVAGNASAATGGSSTTGSSTTGASSAKAGSTPGIQLSDLQNIISGLQAENSKRGSNGPKNASSAAASASSVPLTAVLNADALQTLLANSEFMGHVRELLPESAQPDAPQSDSKLPEQFTSTFKSPQFIAALQTFHAAFQLGSLGPLMSQFNLSERCIDAADRGGQFHLHSSSFTLFLLLALSSSFISQSELTNNRLHTFIQSQSISLSINR